MATSQDGAKLDRDETKNESKIQENERTQRTKNGLALSINNMWYSNKEIILQQYLIHTKTYLTPELDLHTSNKQSQKIRTNRKAFPQN